MVPGPADSCYVNSWVAAVDKQAKEQERLHNAAVERADAITRMSFRQRSAVYTCIKSFCMNGLCRTRSDS